MGKLYDKSGKSDKTFSLKLHLGEVNYLCPPDKGPLKPLTIFSTNNN